MILTTLTRHWKTTNRRYRHCSSMHATEPSDCGDRWAPRCQASLDPPYVRLRHGRVR